MITDEYVFLFGSEADRLSAIEWLDHEIERRTMLTAIRDLGPHEFIYIITNEVTPCPTVG